MKKSQEWEELLIQNKKFFSSILKNFQLSEIVSDPSAGL